MTEKRQQWTPGPWRIYDNIGRTSELGVLADAAPCIIAIMGNAKAWPVEAAANARLIAQAPALYQALRELAIETKSLADRFVRCCVASGSDPEFADIAPSNARKLIAQAEAALLAAEGGQP